jgi:RNA polymerase sigma-70 factor (ECF subfamily)
MQFEKILYTYKNMVYNLALQYVQNIEDAEEITQDVFVAIHHSLNSFKQNAEVSTWIYRIAINKSLDYLKRKKRKKRFGFIVSIFENQETMDVHSFNHPGIELEQKQTIQLIFSALNQLNDQQKTAIILNKIQHKSQKEVAEIMKLTPKAVESLIVRAKNNLLKNLKNKEGL